jgi:pimeloyl-ACP methyl ester carboxylesterase
MRNLWSRRTPLAHYFANLFTARIPHADVQSIIYQFEALRARNADDHHARITSHTIILTGTEVGAHASSFALKERIPGCEMRMLPGAGHACQIEQPAFSTR